MKTLFQDDLLRLDALERYELPGAGGASPALPAATLAALEDLTALAAHLCATPMAGIALVGQDALHFLARVGPGPVRLGRGKLPYETSVHGDDVYVIPDARYHDDYRPDGVMIGGRAFRFYAGAPLVTPAGVAIGALFVQDSVPHTLTDTQRRGLMTLGRQAIAQFELGSRARQMERDARMRQRVESALTVERNFVSKVLDTVGALVAVYDTAGRIVRFNRACEEASGYEFSTLVGRYMWEKLIPTAEIPAAIQTFEQVRSGEPQTSFENQWRHRDGSLRRIAWSATPLVDPQGQVSFIIATGIDVTVQREAETTLRESEARYRQLVEGSLGMVCTHDAEGKLLSLNTHGAESLGRTIEEMVGQNLARYLPDSRQEKFQHYLKTVFETGEAQGLLHIADRDGALRVIAFRNKRIEVEGRAPYVLGFGVDITEQVRAEERLSALIRQSDSILESVGDGIYALDLEGRVTVVNPAAAQMLGYHPRELLGRTLHDAVHHTRADGTPYPIAESPILNTIANLDTVRVSNEIFWRKDGSSFPVEYVARPQIENKPDSHADATDTGEARKGKAIGVVVAFADTTERRALDRMKDEFISTVSHELRTPLTSLRAALGLMTGGTLGARPDKAAQMLEIAVGNTDRLIRLVNDILELERTASGNAELHSETLNAHTLLERATSLQDAAALRAGVGFRIEGEPVEIFADADRVLQALTNLISNALKYSPEGSTVTLRTRALNDGMVQFDVEDQGRGVPADKLESIFERFRQVDASDARAMGGTGLGLAICRGIVQQHGGRIWAESPAGEGARFRFTLPRRPRESLR